MSGFLNTSLMLTNERNGIPNEGKTFRELSDQGLTLWNQHKATGIVDSISYKVETEERSPR
jgi:hypothetical protein